MAARHHFPGSRPGATHLARCSVPRPNFSLRRQGPPGCSTGVHAHRGQRTAATTSSSSPSSVITPADRSHMRRALDLARMGLGKTAPNPAVGCVVLDARGQVVGEGYHPKAGEPHAEVYALRAAGQASVGGTAYVTLEPCAHHGRTPPCARALLAAGVARVVVGSGDPNPLVGGGGLALLEKGGVAVALMDGDEAVEAEGLNPEFMAAMRAQAAKAAASGGAGAA